MAVVLVAAGLALLGGCSGTPSSAPTGTVNTTSTTAGQPSTPSSPGPGPTGTGSGTGTGAPPAPPTRTLGAADKGKTVTVVVGEEVTLTLPGTDWGFTDPKPPSVLTAMSPPIVAKEPGTSSLSFRAAKPGKAIVTANRGGDSFQITVVVQ